MPADPHAPDLRLFESRARVGSFGSRNDEKFISVVYFWLGAGPCVRIGTVPVFFTVIFTARSIPKAKAVGENLTSVISTRGVPPFSIFTAAVA